MILGLDISYLSWNSPHLHPHPDSCPLFTKKVSIRDREATCLKSAAGRTTLPCPGSLPTWGQKPGDLGVSSRSASVCSGALVPSLPRVKPMGLDGAVSPSVDA